MWCRVFEAWHNDCFIKSKAELHNFSLSAFGPPSLSEFTKNIFKGFDLPETPTGRIHSGEDAEVYRLLAESFL